MGQFSTRFLPLSGSILDAIQQAERYNQYLAYLKEANGKVVSRSRGTDPEVCVGVWASGFGGDTRHISICWLESERTAQYKKIEDKWYLYKDW